MKPTTTAILVLALVGAAIGILAPAADAAPYACSDQVTSSCPGLVCVGSTTSVPSCVRDPCRIAHCVTLTRPYCLETQPNCPAGELVCVLPDSSLGVCVTDPCYTTECMPPCACNPYDASIRVPSTPQQQPLLSVCVKGQTAPDCYGNHDVCVGFSLEVPFCVDLPAIYCGPPLCPLTVPNPCETPWFACTGPPPIESRPPPPCDTCPQPRLSAQCTATVGSGAAWAVCVVDGRTVGPVQTCDTCAVLFSETCTFGTEQIRCWPNGIQ
jgi:hypothetical protein